MIRIGFTGRIIAVSLTLIAHTSFVVYFSIIFKEVHIVGLIGYFLWFSIGYWTGKQYDKAKYYSEKDPLTNLYNRRFVMHSFDKVLALTDRSNSKLFILAIDCDNFKDINDIYGHSRGDMVLRMIGEMLVNTTRKSDIVSRWGGDEFLIIGQYKDELGLQIIHQRFDEEFNILSKELKLPVIASIGSSIYPDNSKDLYELIKLADEDMYNRKWKKKALNQK